MDQSKINVRYAKAFFSLAKDSGLTTELRSDASTISSVCTTSADFIALLESPVIKTSQKVKAIRGIFLGHINEISLNFLVLITENNREKNMPGILRYLEGLFRQEDGVKTALLTTAQKLDDAVAQHVKQILESQFNEKVELASKVNEEIIGGFILRVDDTQYDASIATQLKKVKEQLLKTELK